MIKKILNIRNVGKFKNCSMGRGSEFDFAPNTFLFGPNAKGKSTLTAIFSSLSTGDSSYIIGRKTFGSTGDQAVNISFLEIGKTDTTYTFSATGWNKSYSDIVIFDTRFVAKNVYMHESVTEDNEKAVEAVVLGEQGKKLEKNFVDAEEECQKNANRKSEITREFTRHLGHFQVVFDNFRNIKPDFDVDEKINQKENEVKAYSQYQEVKNKLDELIGILKTDSLVSFEAKLTPTISLHQEEIKKHILNHLKTKEGAEAFLAEGTDLLRGKGNLHKRYCVFCGQVLANDAKTLIEAYETLFSDSYKELTQSVKEVNNYLTIWKIEADLRRFSGELLPMGIKVDFSQEIKEINDNIVLFKKELTAKSDLNYTINFVSLKAIIVVINKIKTEIEKLQNQYSSSFDQNKYEALIKDKSSLELIKKRGEKLWLDFCNEYDTLEQKTKDLTKIRDSALQTKNIYAESILSTYEAEVNSVLKDLQADFQLIDTKPKTGLRNTIPLFGICFGSHKIALSADHEEIQHFGNTLGESDKRLLAFAFFIACLKVQGDIHSKIIILDDPLSSLDAERKLRTVNLLKTFINTEKPRQVIILTHEQSFFTLLNEHIPLHKCFKIIYDPTSITSKIEIMQPNEEYLDTYYRQIEELKALESAPDSEINWEKLRPIRDVLEQLFKRKYYLRLKEDIGNGGSVSSFIKKLTTDKVYDSAKSQKVDSLIVNFWNHDDSDSNIKRDNFSVGDLRGILKDFFEIVEII